MRPDDSVHHINGVRDDDRPENLQLRQGNHGNGVVYTCADCGFHNAQARNQANPTPGSSPSDDLPVRSYPTGSGTGKCHESPPPSQLEAL
ncbi:hypothetical protein GCU54_05175 [Geodermatophilus normandii]|uniref:HNH endonuclease n=1 Tax=Geodermatophilus normandii TaxID=1137989 RepID=A0A6P0GB47_9ACTN|nr:hypothetical protein [Geodermatophilus normandii]